MWAFGEAVLDVRTLLAGGKIPFQKTEGNWKTSLSGLLDQSFGEDRGRILERKNLYRVSKLPDVIYR